MSFHKFYVGSAKAEREREKQTASCNFLILMLKDIEVSGKYGAVCGLNNKLSHYSGQNCTAAVFLTTMR
jgi:hypothetical protein